DSNTYAGLRSYDTTSKSAYGGLFLDRLEGTGLVYNLRAQTIRWDTAVNKWKLISVTERKIDGLRETLETSREMHLDLNVRPEEIRFDKYLKDKMTTPELKEYIRREELRGSEGLNEYRVE